MKENTEPVCEWGLQTVLFKVHSPGSLYRKEKLSQPPTVHYCPDEQSAAVLERMATCNPQRRSTVFYYVTIITGAALASLLTF